MRGGKFMKNWWGDHNARSLMVLALVCSLVTATGAQDAASPEKPGSPGKSGSPEKSGPPEKSGTQAATSSPSTKLTEGLLDLLKEPAAAQEPKPASGPAAPGRADDKSPSRIGDERPSRALPGAGEDLGSGPANPLAEVELGMSTAASWLRDQVMADRDAVNRAAELQGDVLARLDQLIEQMQSRRNQSPQSSTQQDTNRDRAGRSQQAKAAQNRSPAQGKQSSSGEQAGATESGAKGEDRSGSIPTEAGGAATTPVTGTSPDSPGVLGPVRERAVIVDLRDPTALQRSAWGNLPERVREQMQSRMVERFLPAYREDIEAYYRALNK